MTLKEQFVKALRLAGYDCWTACEHADKAVREFMVSSKKKETWVVGNTQITATKR